MAGLNEYSENYPYMDNYWDINPGLNSYQYIESDYLPPDEVPRGYKSSIYFTEDDADLKKFIGTGVGIVSLITDVLLSHPFVVLRRQCQVHNDSQRHHIIPLSLIPTIFHLHRNHGLTTLWKGLGSAVLVRGMTLGVEDLLSKVTPWPKEISWHSSVKSFFQHTLLKGISLAIVVPFYSASLMETVQSDIANENPGILDVFKEGCIRLFNCTNSSKGRMLPIWTLVLPTITYGIARYFFSLLVKSGTFRLLQIRQSQSRPVTGAVSKYSRLETLQDLELTACLVGTISADIMFYPFETILHRLHLQGTRTIIDNLDNGRSVLPILTNYHGPIDCYEGCLKNEGVFGLYKGFGALVLQYVAHILVLRFSKFILTEACAILYKPKKSPDHTSPLIQHAPLSNPKYL